MLKLIFYLRFIKRKLATSRYQSVANCRFLILLNIECHTQNVNHAGTYNSYADDRTKDGTYITHDKRNKCTTRNGHDQQTRNLVGTIRHFLQRK